MQLEPPLVRSCKRRDACVWLRHLLEVEHHMGSIARVNRRVAALAGAMGVVATAILLVTALPPAGASLATTTAPPVTTVPTTTTTSVPPWQATWTSSMDFYDDAAVNATARDVAQVTLGGTSIELSLSNSWSNTPTTFGSVTVGVQQNGPSLVPGSIVPVTFGSGSRSVTIPAKQNVTSDPLAMTVHPGEVLAVSLSISGSAAVTVHYCCEGRTDSYATKNNAGDLTADAAGTAFTLADGNMRWLSAISVSGTPALGTIVAFGDSITDGFQDGGFGWPTPLQERIGQLPSTEQMAVVNEGISGNTLTVFPPNLTYAMTSGGLPGVTRLQSDALSIPGTKDVVLFLGTNDIWFGGRLTSGPPYGTATAIIGAMQSVIQQVHAAGMRIFGVTLLPRDSSPPGPKQEIWTPADQNNLQLVNAWVRSAKNGFDGVLDFAAVEADVYNGQCNPNILFAPYNSNDNLHPSPAGQVAMANAVPTTLFQIPEAPQLPPMVPANPTPHCAGALAAERAMSLARGQTTPTTIGGTGTGTGTHTPSPSNNKSHVLIYVLIGLAAALLIAIIAVLVLRRRGVHKLNTKRGIPNTRSP